jgi:hypothetical protein
MHDDQPSDSGVSVVPIATNRLRLRNARSQQKNRQEDEFIDRNHVSDALVRNVILLFPPDVGEISPL